MQEAINEVESISEDDSATLTLEFKISKNGKKEAEKAGGKSKKVEQANKDTEKALSKGMRRITEFTTSEKVTVEPTVINDAVTAARKKLVEDRN